MEKQYISLEDFQLIENQIKASIEYHFPIVLKKTKDDWNSDKLNSALVFNETAKNIYWQFNKKSVQSNNMGDLTSANLWKFSYELFPRTEFDDENKNNEKVEREFITKLSNEFCLKLNQNIPDNLCHHVLKYEIKNTYFNVFLKNEAKNFIDKKVEETKPKPKHDAYTMQPIGTFHSCFPEKFSTPRQGGLLAKTKGKIVFDTKVVELSCIDGIEDFEYFWVVYIFHLHSGFKGTKVSPPKKDITTDKETEDKKLGIYATRTPHRINPIGLTLVKLDKVKNGEMYISGIDMVDGTPIVDIKPYHHLESVQVTKYPDWILNAEKDKELQRNKVIFKEEAENQLKSLIPKLEFYSDYDEIHELIKELLEIDPHSKFTKTKSDTLLYAFYIDKLNVIYEFNATEKNILIISIEYVEEYKKLRNKDWLKNYNK
jgi:tRNA-Thr(GGU) m(6)t(6)A37 methyltransferase TsaA